MDKKSILDLLTAADDKLTNLVKDELNKLSDVDRKEVFDKTNNVVKSLCDTFGVKDPEKYFVTEDMFDNTVESCKKAFNDVKSKCEETKEKFNELASEYVTKEDAVDVLNSTIKTVFDKFGFKNPEKYMIKDPEKVYLNVAHPSDGVTLTTACYDSRENVCGNETCEECDGKCRNEECAVDMCQCKTTTNNSMDDADNDMDAPAKLNVPRVDLNLSAPKKDKIKLPTKRPVYAATHLAPELRDPAGTHRVRRDAHGNEYVGANPYSESENAKTPLKPVLADIKKRLQSEAKDFVETTNNNVIKAFKETLVTKVTSILEDSDTHNYIVHPATPKSPAAVEVCLEDVSSTIRNNIYILSEIETELKNLYDFPEVHINVCDTDDTDVVNLIVFMVLE